MAWRRTGDKPLPEPLTIQFTDIYDLNMLTHCGLVMPYGDIELVNIGLGNG